MSRPKRTPVGDRASITYQRNQTPETSSSVAFVNDGAPEVSQSNDRCSLKTVVQSPDLLSTAELMLAAGRVWSRVNPPADLESRSELNQTNSRNRKSISLSNLSGKAVGCASSTYNEDMSFCVNSTITSRSTYMVQQSSELFRVTQKLLVSTPHVSSCTFPFLWPIRRLGTYFPGLEKVYEWMKDRHHAEPQPLLTNCEEGNGGGMCSEGSKSRKMEHHSSDATLHSDGFTLESTNWFVESEDFARHATAEASSLPSDFIDASLQDVNMTACVMKVPFSILRWDYSFDFVSPHKCTFAKLLDDFVDSGVHLNTHNPLQVLLIEDEKKRPTNSTLHERQNYSLAKQEHAFAGAFAGTFVSLCLHPIDTVKTVLQSCGINQKPIWYIGRSVIAERGIMGLYRGLASNIACSAPISGIYTFTYESVKGALLPLVSKEYHSFTHCTAGGCASIATSFVFTPSEHVKQQMQVGSRYHNCWNALVGVIKKGGLSSLYAGWGAVLCRNVPHSIIKFYTYESLKRLILAPQSSGGLPNVSQTLVCGGLAGSTAALFTTPFDVVKTRLQTQVPGSPCRYDGVLHAVRDISKHEGLKGLYRGLLPRILMYMSQGALFFTSYEFLKQLFSLEMPGLDTGGTPIVRMQGEAKTTLESISRVIQERDHPHYSTSLWQNKNSRHDRS